MKLFEMPAHLLAAMLRSGETTSVKITESILDRIDAVEDKLHAYNSIDKEAALTQAAAVDRKFAAGEDLPPLAGIPFALKDNMCTYGRATTCSSKILENFIAPYNATVVDKLAAQQTVLIGKANMDEFAMGSSTENSAFGMSKNPWNTEYVPGGSSGGSAVAVAGGEAVFSLGSDTGGSIRQPASFCGVVGFKPTYGAVSRYGLIAFASSLDQIGPFTRDITDCAMVMNAIAGHDAKDSTSAAIEHPDYVAALKNDVKGMKIALPKEFFGEGIDSRVRDYILAACDVLKGQGAVIEEISLPSSVHGLPAYYIVAPAEASSNLARFDGVRYGYRDKDTSDLIEMYFKSREHGFGSEVKRRIMIGTYALSSGYYDAYYVKALKVRRLIYDEFRKAFDNYDAIITPTSPTLPFKAGAISDPIQMYMADICTIPANLAGIPGISLPCGQIDGLPVGLQIMGKAFSEETLLRIAYTYEQNTDHHLKRAVVAAEGEV